MNGIQELDSGPGPRRLKVGKPYARLAKMSRATMAGARLHREEIAASGFRAWPVMVTLTYADGRAWSPNHIRDFLQRVRVYLRRRGARCRFVWVAELQQRGAVHYHVLLFLPWGLKLPKVDLRGWWTAGAANVKLARHAAAYLAKYASKASEQAGRLLGAGADFPPGCRIHGTGGLTRRGQMQRRWLLAPEYVRSYWQAWRQDVARAIGGGWLSRATGEWQPTRWLVQAFSRAAFVIQETLW